MAARRPLVLVDGQIRQMTVDEFNDLRWQMLPLGMKFTIDTHTTGVPVPPTDNPNYRYIKLTASDSYNTGVLTSESVSGSAPLVQATALISDPSSPMNGQTVQLINTERRVIRAGSSGTVEADAMQRITGDWSRMVSTVPPIRSDITIEPSGAFGRTAFSGSGPGGISFSQNGAGLTFDSSGSPGARTADETRPKNIGADYYMRIR